MGLGDLLHRIWADPTTASAIVVVVALAILDLVIGTLRAFASDQFDPGLIDVWVRKTLAGRVLPIVFVLLFGAAIGDIGVGDFHFNILVAAGLAAAALFAISTAQSIIDSLNPKVADKAPTE